MLNKNKYEGYIQCECNRDDVDKKFNYNGIIRLSLTMPEQTIAATGTIEENYPLFETDKQHHMSIVQSFKEYF